MAHVMRALGHSPRSVLQNKNNEKNNDQESAATNIHINLHRVAHPL